ILLLSCAIFVYLLYVIIKWLKINIKHRIKVKMPHLFPYIKLIPVARNVRIEKNKRLFFISGFLKKLTLLTNLVSKPANGFYYFWIFGVIFYFFTQAFYIHS